MMAKGIRGEAEEKREIVEEVKKKDVDVDARTVEETTTDPSSPISEVSCQTTVAKPIPLPGRTRGPTRRSTKGGWTEEEDEILARAVKQFKGKNWKKIAEFFSDRSDVQCLHRWQKVLDPELVKGAWTKEEDERIIELVSKYGPKKWAIIARKMPGRIGKQCRERWHNHLNPAIKKGAWTTEEEITLIRAHQIYGNKWAEIAKLLPGRADNSIKNHWNCSVKKRLDSYLSSGHLGQLPKVAALDLNITPADVECPGDCSTPKVKMIIDQKPIPAMMDATSTSLFHRSLRMSKEDPECCKTGAQPSTMETFRGSKEVPGSIKRLAARYCDDASPGSDLSSLPPKNDICCPNTRDCATSILHKDEYDHSRALDAIIPTTPLQGKPYTSIDSEPCLQMQSHDCNTKELFAPPEGSERHSQASNTLITMDMISHLNQQTTLAQQEKRLLDLHKVVNNDQSPCTPVLVDKVILDHDYYHPIWLSNLQENITKAKFSESDESMIGLESAVCWSAPPKFSLGISLYSTDPETILRNAAKSFRNMPSILRKRHQKHLGPSVVKKPHKGHVNAEELSGACDPVAKVESTSDASGLACLHQCEIQAHDDRTPNDAQHVRHLFLSSSVASKSEIYEAMRSIEKRLEFAFDMEWDHANTNHSTSMVHSPLSTTGSVNNHVDI